MNRNRLLIIGVLALALGTLVSYAVYTTLRRTVASVRESNTQVVVAATDLQVGTKLEDKDLREIKLPGSDLPPGAAGRWRSVHTSTAINGKGAPAALAAPATPSCRDMARATPTSATSFASQS